MSKNPKENSKPSDLDLTSQRGVMDLLQKSTLHISEFLTGVFVSDKKDWKLSAGHLVQSVIKGGFLTQLGREIQIYQQVGRIKEDYMATSKNRVSLYEFLKYLDENVPDDDLFNAMKSIFFSGISTDSTQQDEAFSYEFLRTAKQMTGMEILILRANFDIVEGRGTEDVKHRVEKLTIKHHRSAWRSIVSVQMGLLEHAAMVGKYERSLEVLGLIAPRNEDNRFSGDFEPTSKFRLTEFGYKFCQFITNY